VVFPTALALGSWLLAAQPSNYAEVLHADTDFVELAAHTSLRVHRSSL
jgi:hypothetical protein